MNKKIIAIIFLILVCVPGVMYAFGSTPLEYVFTPEPRVSRDFAISADGAESADSITSFSETLADDVLYFPDSLDDETLATAGVESYGTPTGDYEDTWIDDTTYYSVFSNQPAGTMLAELTLDFTVPTTTERLKITSIAYHTGVGTTDSEDILLWNYDTSAYVDVGDINEDSFSTETYETFDSDYWSVAGAVKIRLSAGYTTGTNVQLFIDYLLLEYSIMTLADSTNFAESFADVTDWNAVNDPITSDGDIATLTSSAGNVWDRYDCNTPTAQNWHQYYGEVRVKANVSICRFYVYVMTADDYGTPVYHSEALSTNVPTEWTTYKWILNEGEAYTAESVSLLFRGLYDCALEIDYLRIQKSDEMGYQHDGSIITGTTTTGTATSDGDTITFTADDNLDYSKFYVDQTATKTFVELGYYPFLEIDIDSVSGSVYRLDLIDGLGASSTLKDYSSDVGIFRFNMEVPKDTLQAIRIYQATSGGVITVNYVKAYSIANFTVASFSDESLTDVVYVDSGKLVVSSVTNDVIQFYNDLALSVDSATFTVWSATIQSGSDNFRMYIDAFYDTGETRGSMPSGTTTDFLFRSYGALNISEITFIEDHTDPSIVRSNANPPEPADDETVTLSALVIDAVEVYSVTFNAVVYPVGFSDVDYSGSESSTNFWTYSFSTLLEGYYSFSVIASDGVNENDLETEYEYIDLTVRESEITISPITFFGVGEDFTQMSLSFEINRDCSYTIYEASASEAESATGSGNVNQGWDNIAWDKLTVTDLQVNFSIKFETGALSTWVNGSYSVAQTAFVLENCFITEAEKSFTITGSLTKAGSWAIRWDGAAEVSYSGSESEGYVSITWTKHETPGAHTWLLTFSNTSSFSLGGSFEVYQTNIDDKPGPPGPPVESDWRINQTTWQNIALLLIVLGVLANLFKGQTKLNLPNLKDSDLD